MSSGRYGGRMLRKTDLLGAPYWQAWVGPYSVRFWRRASWRPFLHRRTVVLAGGVFGFCFQVARTYRWDER